MTEFKMSRNGSGVYDETAYKALNEMAKDGEIWTYSNGGAGSTEREALVIKNHGTLCTVLVLMDENKSNHCIEIRSNTVKYTDPRMMQYMFNDRFGKFVKRLPDDDFNAVLDEIEDALEVNVYRKDANDALETAKAEVKELKAQLEAERSKPVSDIPSESIYKRLYDDLIDKLIEKRVV